MSSIFGKFTCVTCHTHVVSRIRVSAYLNIEIPPPLYNLTFLSSHVVGVLLWCREIASFLSLMNIVDELDRLYRLFLVMYSSKLFAFFSIPCNQTSFLRLSFKQKQISTPPHTRALCQMLRLPNLFSRLYGSLSTCITQFVFVLCIGLGSEMKWSAKNFEELSQQYLSSRRANISCHKCSSNHATNALLIMSETLK